MLALHAAWGPAPGLPSITGPVSEDEGACPGRGPGVPGPGVAADAVGRLSPRPSETHLLRVSGVKSVSSLGAWEVDALWK